MKATIPEHRLQPIRYCNDIVVSACRGREDVILWRALHETTEGFYVDVGAGDPNWGSPTRWLYENGWCGLNIEPHPVMFPILELWRPRDINLNCGISDQPGTLTYYRVDPTEVGTAWGLSSFNPDSARAARAAGYTVVDMPIDVISLTSAIDKHCGGRTIDLLKIDVEGYERSVVNSLDWKRIRPRVVCIEATQPASPNPSFEKWELLIVNSSYTFVLFDGINNYYVRDESTDIMSQFNCGVNGNDRYRDATIEDMKEPWLQRT